MQWRFYADWVYIHTTIPKNLCLISNILVAITGKKFSDFPGMANFTSTMALYALGCDIIHSALSQQCEF